MLFFGHLLVRSFAFTRRATMSIPSREGLTQEIPIRGQNFAFGPISPAGAPVIKRDPI